MLVHRGKRIRWLCAAILAVSTSVIATPSAETGDDIARAQAYEAAGDRANAIRHWRRAALSGSLAAYVRLAELWFEEARTLAEPAKSGRLAEAERLLRYAADRGHLEAKVRLAAAWLPDGHLAGRGDPMPYLEQAARSGHREARRIYIRHQLEHAPPGPLPANLLAWLEQAATEEGWAAMVLAQRYRDGAGVPRDLDAAIRWAAQAARAEEPGGDALYRRLQAQRDTEEEQARKALEERLLAEQRALEAARQETTTLRNQIAEERAAIARDREELERQAKAMREERSRLEELVAEMRAEREAKTRAQEQAMAALENEYADTIRLLAERDQTIAALRAEKEQWQRERERMMAEIARMRDEIAMLEGVNRGLRDALAHAEQRAQQRGVAADEVAAVEPPPLQEIRQRDQASPSSRASRANGHEGRETTAETWYARGVEALKSKDYARASDAFGLAADLGHADAISNLGVMALRGMGRPVDIREAERLFRRAAAMGSEAARANLTFLHRQGLVAPSSEVKEVKAEQRSEPRNGRSHHGARRAW